MAGEHLNAVVVREERRVHVDDPARKHIQESRAENQHPAGKDDQIGLEGARHRGQPAVIRFSRDRVETIDKRQRNRGHSGGRRSPQGAGIGTVADDDGHLGLERAARGGVEQRLQIRPRARGENRDPPQGNARRTRSRSSSRRQGYQGHRDVAAQLHAIELDHVRCRVGTRRRGGEIGAPSRRPRELGHHV